MVAAWFAFASFFGVESLTVSSVLGRTIRMSCCSTVQHIEWNKLLSVCSQKLQDLQRFFFFTKRSQPNCYSLSYKTEEISRISTYDPSLFLNEKVIKKRLWFPGIIFRVPGLWPRKDGKGTGRFEQISTVENRAMHCDSCVQAVQQPHGKNGF